MKQIPVGIDNFEKMITNNYYFIDKTKFIEEVINHAEVKLFTRPRRFGKTLIISMLKYFFNIKNAEENKKLFSGLYIENSPAFSEQGKYPVISITLKEVFGLTWKETFSKLQELISSLYSDFTYIRNNLDEIEQEKFNKIYSKNDTNISHALSFLSKILSKYYNKKVIILIDEYDSPLVNAYTKGYYDEAIDFFKSFYGSVLKSNDYLEKAVLTGIIRVASAGIFSDLNNLKIYTLLKEQYDEYFGLTEAEVVKTLNDFNLEYKINEVKSWYNGYKFGNKEIYNPWSIINYIEEKKLIAYWVDTSENVLIRNILFKADNSVHIQLDSLIKDNNIMVTLRNNVPLGGNMSTNDIWELFLYSGYLTVEEQISNSDYLVRIPNEEVKLFFKNIFAEIVFKNIDKVLNVRDAFIHKKINKIEEIFKNVLLDAMSFNDTDKRYENVYQTLLSGLLCALVEIYTLHPNSEIGYGRADIILIPTNKNYPGYIFELKIADKSEDLNEVAKNALKQINDKKYDSLLINEGVIDIVKIGLAFRGKEVEVVY